ncbi:hypothetical protein [Pseudomonas sp. 43NM1]|jgi:hypothetical protein|uniref:hypothetical protein n=1 Tax=Pseudomonas sp. 43NM1 TaxID=1904755 RepID=UPI000C345F65|nr:hypothetical protein [Pseudomonas sp. 43NM1]
MSLAMTIFSMIAAWMAVALAMLWGVLRIARRHQPPVAVSVYRERRAPMARGWAVSLSSN